MKKIIAATMLLIILSTNGGFAMDTGWMLIHEVSMDDVKLIVNGEGRICVN
jgi:hypothetical protein